MSIEVNTTSPVDEKVQPYLAAWDQSARTYHSFFEIHRMGALNDLFTIRQSTFAGWKNPIQIRHRFEKVDELELRQQLGEIQPHEVKELNRVMDKNCYFTRGRSEPALLKQWNTFPILGFLGAGMGFGLVGKFVRGYNILWLGATILPCALYLIHNAANQNSTRLQNAYRYLLEKRAATCQMEKNMARFQQASFAQTAEFQALSEHMGSRRTNLYEMEAALVNQIAEGKF